MTTADMDGPWKLPGDHFPDAGKMVGPVELLGPEPEEMQWRAIETAPKDGTRVLLYRAGLGESMAVAWFSHDFDEWTPVNGSVFPCPTHWLPLPPPPKDTK